MVGLSPNKANMPKNHSLLFVDGGARVIYNLASMKDKGMPAGY